MILVNRNYIFFQIFIILLSFSKEITSFWFTDNSLFISPELQQPQTADINKQPEVATTTNAQNNPKQQDQQQESPIIELGSNNLNFLDKELNRWQTVSYNQAQSNPKQLPSNQFEQQCQCNADWLQNQTNVWLNRWLKSPNFTNQIQRLLFVSNSTGANNNNINLKLDAKQSEPMQQNNNAANNHWSFWAAHKSAQNVVGSIDNLLLASNPASNNNGARANNSTATTIISGPITNNRIKKQHGSQRQLLLHHQQPSKVFQGPQGPKGETGAKGERGPSGIVSVANRDALFDLNPLPVSTTTSAPASTSPNQKDSLSSSTTSKASSLSSPKQQSTSNNQVENNKELALEQRLAFIESEQMLVVQTNLGWRPVQLLAPLRDFRKVVSKFSLTSSEQRRRFMSSQQNNNNNRGITGTKTRGNKNNNKDSNSIRSYSSLVHQQQQPLKRSKVHNIENNNIDHTNNELPSIELNAEDAAVDLDHNNKAQSTDFDDDEDLQEEEDDDDDDDDDDQDEEDDDDNGDDDEDDDDDDDDDDDADAKGFEGNDNNEGSRRNIVASENTSGKGARSEAGAKTVEMEKKKSPLSGRSAMSSHISYQHHNREQEKQRQQLSGAPIQSTTDKEMKLRIAALNEPFSGNIHGIRGADFECKRSAAKANVKGSFKAFMATGFQNLNEIVRYNIHKYPIVNLKGETLANSWHDLFKSPAKMPNPLSRIYSFDGRHVANDSKWPNKLVWHGANNKFGHRDPANNCDGWHSDSLSKFGFATPVHHRRFMSNNFNKKHKNYLNQQQQLHRRKRLFVHDNLKNPSNNSVSMDSSLTGPNNLTYQQDRVAVFELTEKYPCRMPLIVLCIETIGQQSSATIPLKQQSSSRISFEQNNDNSNLLNYL